MADGGPWYEIAKTIPIVEKGLLVLCGPGTEPGFSAEDGDRVEIARAGRPAIRTRIIEVCSNPSSRADDLILDLIAKDVFPGCRLRVLKPAGKRKFSAED